MKTQAAKADLFRTLHVKGAPLILFNIWDAGSANAVTEAGAKALATGSWSVAAAHGFADGEALPRALVLENVRRIVAASALPVTLDFERGYGETPAEVSQSVAAAVEAGAIGFNIEDGLVEGLRTPADQAARLAAARAATPMRIFLNARTDLFLKAPIETHDARLVEEALQRLRHYASAGADGYFVPGLVDESLIADVCARSPLPVNVMMTPRMPPPQRLAAVGVARISHGPGPYRLAMHALRDAARQALR